MRIQRFPAIVAFVLGIGLLCAPVHAKEGKTYGGQEESAVMFPGALSYKSENTKRQRDGHSAEIAAQVRRNESHVS